MKNNSDELFEEGIKLRDNGQLAQAAEIFIEIINQYPDDPKLGGIHTVLAGVYFDLNLFNDSVFYFHKATQLNPKSELASLGLYLSYIELNNSDMAINELKRYLEKYPADHYRDTLSELLSDLDDGYATKYRETIISLAKKNGLM